MTGIETALLIGGSVLGAAGSVIGGIQAQQQADYQAKVQRRQAEEARAASQREAIRRAREARYVLSRQQAIAAASGGSATDPTVLDLMGDVAGEGEYQKAAALYEGNARGSSLEAQAALNRMAGRQAMLGGFVNAGTTLLSGASQWARYRNTGVMTTPNYTYG